MNVLILCTSELSGGAAIAANRLMRSLNRSDRFRSKMLVRDSSGSAPEVAKIGNKCSNRAKFLFERLIIWISNRFSRENLFQVSIANTGYDITTRPEFLQADIIHIHWTQQGMLSLRGLEKILASGKPVVWTMHDMWVCTGICHHSESCDKYTEHCGNCQYLNGSREKDLSYRIFEAKMKLYRQHRFELVACSRWLQNRAMQSALLAGKTVHCIPNPLDTERFCPGDKAAARKELGLPEKGRLVLFASQKVTDPRKGIGYLAQASRILKDRGVDFEFVVMGQNSESLQEMLCQKVHSLGYVSSEEKSILVYRACDLFVTPSLMENLPNTIMESMACGTPCVGFNVGGIPEMIDDGVNGYVAEYKSAQDCSDCIVKVIANPSYETLCRNARQKAVESYSMQAVGAQFEDLYNSLVK